MPGRPMAHSLHVTGGAAGFAFTNPDVDNVRSLDEEESSGLTVAEWIHRIGRR